MTSLDRRNFLLALAGGAAAAPFLSPFSSQVIAQASEHSKRRFVFLYLPGGWDQLLFLDPRSFEFEAGSDAEYRAEVERTGIDTAYRFGGYENGTTDLHGTDLHRVAGAEPSFYFGPAAVRLVDGAPASPVNLVSLAERGVPMSMVRGINMGTLGHEPGYLYFLTGQPAVGSSARGTSMPIRIAAQLADADPALAGTLLPTVALSVSSYTGDRDGRLAALRAETVDDLQRILARPDALQQTPEVEAALTAYARRPLGPIAQRYDRRGLLSGMVGASDSARRMLENDVAAAFRFLDEDTDLSRAVRSRYDLTRVESASARRSAKVGAAFVSQAIKLELAQFISATLPAGGDSHGAGNRAHAVGLHAAADAIARLVDDLAESPASADLGGSWLDHTTICVFSEFARTPRFNATGGRDHHFTNSCLLIGAGIQPGRVAGASSETRGMAPVAFDFDAQETLADDAPGGTMLQRHITPADIGSTLLASADLDYGEYRDGEPLWKLLTQTPY